MNKNFIILFEIVFLVSLISAANIAMVVKDANSLSFIHEQPLKQILEQQGYTVNLIDKNNQADTNYSDYDLILIAGRPSNVYSTERLDSFVSDIPVNDNPTIAIDSEYIHDFGWGDISTIYTTQLQRVFIPQNNHLITSDYSGFTIVHIVEGKTIQSLSSSSTNLTPLASLYDTMQNQIISVADSGTQLSNGDITKKRIVFFGITNPAYWTIDAKNLFLNSIEWALYTEDLDNDGFPAYADCNDENSLINPSITEIPYDGIDNDCSGNDLADVDGDGYCKEGYLIKNKFLQCPLESGDIGTDCNDNNTEYNIGSINSTKNCINEAPVFSGAIPNIIWNEDNTPLDLNLSNYFIDPEGDDLTFGIFSAYQDSNIDITVTNGVVNFSSKENWNGEESIIFYANDKELNTTTNNIKLIVKPINDAPVFNQINNIKANESELIEFNISASDIDGDNLIYSVENLPSGAVFSNKTFSWVPNYFQKGTYNLTFIVTDGEEFDEKDIQAIIGNTNRAPVIEFNEDVFLNEDTTKEISINASDPDNDNLTYTILNEDANEVDCNLNENKITFIPYPNWYGNASCKIQINDGEMSTDKVLKIIVSSLNDAPYLSPLQNITAIEEDLITIYVNATDVDNDVLTYSIDDARFIDNNNGVFSWQTNYTDSGTYYFNVSVSDGEFTESQTIEIVINNKNQAPVIEDISDITIDEDSGFTLVKNLSASDSDGTINRFEVSFMDANKVNCSIVNSSLGITPAENFQGNASCTIKAYDNEEAYAEKIVNIFVNNINDAPEIISYTPDLNIITPEDAEVLFKINYQDIDNENKDIKLKWYQDNVEVGTGDEYNFVGNGTIKDFNIKAVIDDGEKNDSVEWTLTTTNIPMADNYNGNTTNFSEMNESELEFVNLILEKTDFGKIEFLEPVDLRDVADLDNHAEISNGLCSIDSDFYPALKDKKAKITFYNLNFAKTPALYYNPGFTLNPINISQICSDSMCSNINYNGNELSFIVNGFSSFMAGNTLTCSQKSGDICSESEICRDDFIESRDSNYCCPVECIPSFKDTDTCSVLNSNLELTIKNPDVQDEFNPEDTISINVKVRNNFNNKNKFFVMASLYDLNEDRSIEEKKDSVKIASGDSQIIELPIEIPKDIGENNFDIFIKAENEDGDLCNQDYTSIKITRESDKLSIKKIEIYPNVVSSKGILNVNIKVENLGSNSQDAAYVVVENNELGIYEKSNEFDIEEFGESDTRTLSFNFEIPPNSLEKIYNLNAKLFFSINKQADSGNETFEIQNNKRYIRDNLDTTQKTILLGNENQKAILLSSATNEFIKLNSENSIEKKSLFDFSKVAVGISIMLLFLVIIIFIMRGNNFSSSNKNPKKSALRKKVK